MSDGERPGRSGKPSLPGWLANLMLLVGTLVVFALLFEGAVRIASPQLVVRIRPDVWVPADGVGHTKVPNLDTYVRFGRRKIRLLTDEQGHRVGSSPYPRDARRILAIGDSFLEALNYEHEETVTGVLERKLSEKLQTPFAVVNTGVGGWDPNRYLIKAQHELQRASYELVLVFVYVGNDVIEERVPWFPPRPSVIKPLRFPKSLAYREVVDAVAFPVYLTLSRWSQAVVWLNGRLASLRARFGLTHKPFPKTLLRSQADSPCWDVTCSVLGDLAAEAALAHVPALFVIIPADYQIHEKAGQTYAMGTGYDLNEVDLGQPSRILREKLESSDLRVVDLAPEFAARTADGTKLYGKVNRHLTAAGHAAVAEVLAPVVEKLLREPAG